MSKYIDLTDRRLSKLVVESLYDSGWKHKSAKWNSIYDCGNKKIVNIQMLRINKKYREG